MMKIVKYVGPAHRRRIGALDWREAGFEAEAVEWSWENGFAVPAETFSDEQMREVIEPDTSFVIEEGEEDDVKPRRLQHRMTGQQYHESPRINMTGAVGADRRSPASTGTLDRPEGPSGSGPAPVGPSTPR